MAMIGTDVEFAARFLLDGKIVAIPTETVYGLAANALDEKAVLLIFEAKQRPFFDPLIIHVASIESARKYAHLEDPRLIALAEKFWPGPLTLLLPKKNIPDIVTSGLPSVAVRVPRHPLTLSLLNRVNVPLAAPSANPFGYVSPTEPAHVNRQLGKSVAYILDGGPSQVGIESTIVGIEDDQPCVYRLGGLAIEDIERVAGKVDQRINLSGDPSAPGQLKNHYAPRKPLFVGDIAEIAEKNKSLRYSVICFGPGNFPSALYVYQLSSTKNDEEAALNLFRLLRLADEDGSDIVICGKLPDKGLGIAVNDRLRRASVRS